jgi:hypothetical protein
MRYHDFHLEGYAVTKFDGEIVLDLIWNYPDSPSERSRIRFSDVAAYHFIHTGGAIITNITDMPLPDFFSEYGDQIAEWWRLHGGFLHWKDERAEYIETLKQKGYSAWSIDSAIGFQGFVIARSVGEDASDLQHRPNTTLEPTATAP